MPGESEYHRSYKPLERADERLAGLSSAKQALTQEPAFTRKRKPPDHGRKVTFVTDYTEHGAPLVSGPDKAMYFRAGLRRAQTMIPTEYQLQYTWKEPVLDSPLLSAENTLHQNKNHSDVDPGDDERGRPFNNTNQNGNQDKGDGHSQLQQREHTHSSGPLVVDLTSVGSQERQHHSNKNASDRESSKKKFTKERVSKQENASSRQVSKSVDAPLLKNGHIQLSKQSAKKSKQKKKGRHYLKAKMAPQIYTTEYRSQFKESRTKKTGHKMSGKTDVQSIPVAGQPPVLTDQTDPRLLKHSPLPVNKLFYLPSTKWGSEYSSNFMAPEKFDFEGGVWQGASQPDLLTKPAAKEEESESKNSWFDQLLELRKKADDYKRRAQTTHFLPHHLLVQQHEHLLDSADTSSTLTSSETPFSPSSTTSTVSDSIPKSNKRPSRTNGFIGASPVLKQRAVPNLNGSEGDMRVEDVEDIDTETVTSEQSSSNGSIELEKALQQHGISTGHAQTKVKAKSGAVPVPLRVSVSKLIPHGSPQGKGQSTDEEVSDEGRVDTPRLVKSRSDHRRHHLDITTPAGGGLLISPTKKTHSDKHSPPPVGSVQLPFPPTSPKFRKDMKSSALIYPSPTQKKLHVVSGDDPARYEGNSHSKQKSVPLSSNAGQHHGTGMESRNGTQTMGPRSVPVSGSPYHTQCVSDPPVASHHKQDSGHPLASTGESGPVRKLVFDGQKSTTTSKTNTHHRHHHPALSQLQQYKSSSIVADTCKTCGAHLHSSGISTTPKHTSTSLSLQQQQEGTKYHHKQPVSSSLHSKTGARPTTVGDIARTRPSYKYPLTTTSQPRPLSQHTPYVSSQKLPSAFQSENRPGFLPPKMTVGTLSPGGGIPDSGIGSSRRVVLGDGRGCYGGEGGVMSEPSVVSQDFDNLSLSSMSLSSCSVASEILKKARDRRDHFWTQPPLRVAAT